MKRILTFVLSLALLLTAACAKAPAETTAASTTTETTAVTTTAAEETTAAETTPAETTEAETTPAEELFAPAPRAIEWDPYRLSGIVTDIFGEAAEADFKAAVSAILNREPSSPVTCDAFGQEAPTFFAELFPLQSRLCSVSFENGEFIFQYVMSEEEQTQLVEDFRLRVAEIGEECLTEADTPAEAALALYHFLTWYFTYDYEAAESEEVTDVTPIRALMDGCGICQSFAAAYAYLATQIGVDAFPISGYTDEFSHEWTLVKLDGELYHMDVTFENGTEGCGLVYFGMDNDARAVDLPVDSFNVFNTLWADEVACASHRFDDLHTLTDVTDLLRTEDGLLIVGTDADGDRVEIEMP